MSLAKVIAAMVPMMVLPMVLLTVLIRGVACTHTEPVFSGPFVRWVAIVAASASMPLPLSATVAAPARAHYFGRDHSHHRPAHMQKHSA
jgi:hypothetical protein